MSHFTVTVCLDNEGFPNLSRAASIRLPGVLKNAIETRLATALDPFDENKEVEPYRDYESGSPADHWAANLFRKENELNPDDATLTWAQIAEAHNTRWPDPVNDPLLVDSDGDTSRAYTMSTYNPDSKWDWYVIGGRWPGRFSYRQKRSDLVITGERSLMLPDDEVIIPRHCDGGQKLALNLDITRDEAAKEAQKQYAKYKNVITGTPEALPWSTFTDNISPENGYTIERAREEYGSQPRIKALRNDREWAFKDNEDYACGQKLFIERARARAIPGYTMLTTDGRWLTPGDMGWFGMRNVTEGSQIGYWETANAYIEALPDDAWLVSVDAHI